MPNFVLSLPEPTQTLNLLKLTLINARFVGTDLSIGQLITDKYMFPFSISILGLTVPSAYPTISVVIEYFKNEKTSQFEWKSMYDNGMVFADVDKFSTTASLIEVVKITNNRLRQAFTLIQNTYYFSDIAKDVWRYDGIEIQMSNLYYGRAFDKEFVFSDRSFQ